MPCPVAVPQEPLAATIEDFVLAYGDVEAVELSNIDSVGSTIYCDRLNQALVDAYNYLQSVAALGGDSARLLVQSNLRRWMLILARYYLDSIRRRSDVTADFEQLAKLLNIARKGSKELSQGSQYDTVSIRQRRAPLITQQQLETYRSDFT
jgi:hypothetical protein